MPVTYGSQQVQVEIIQLLQGNYLENVLNFSFSGGEAPNYADLYNLLSDVIFPFVNGADFKYKRSDHWAVVGLKATHLDTGIMAEYSDGLPVFGAETTSTINQNAMVIAFYTAEASQAGRGRNYVGGIASSQVEGNGLWNSTVVSHYFDAYDTMAAFALTQDWHFGVLSRYLDGDPRSPAVFHDMTSIGVRIIPGSMATRRIGRGS